mmetsp:Transcript_10702/g.32925  ORF Transcript_10702/g.32925 Transcript_10702/m.32925 type:complete len:387 (+) Transcript_10702:78-1238(+)
MPRKGFVLLMLVSVASAFQLFGQKKKCSGVTTRRSAHSDAGIGGNGPMPVEIALRIAKQRAKDGGEAAVADLQKLELENPEQALAAVASERALDAKGFESWKWGRLAEEAQRVSSALKVAGVPLDATLPSDAHVGALNPSKGKPGAPKREAEWRARSRALSELQYWTLRGNRKAEAGLLLAVRSHAGNWVGAAADQLLRQAWGVHADAGVNSLMQRARDALKKKDAASALKGFEAAAGRSRELDEGSGFADAHRWIGLTFHRALDDPTAARAALEEALDASPHNYVVMMDLGKLLAARATTATRDADSVAIAAWLAGAPAPEPRDQDAELEAARAYFDRATALNPALVADVVKVLPPRPTVAAWREACAAGVVSFADFGVQLQRAR